MIEYFINPLGVFIISWGFWGNGKLSMFLLGNYECAIILQQSLNNINNYSFRVIAGLKSLPHFILAISLINQKRID